MDEINKKLDKIIEEISEVKITQARVDVTLDKQHDQLAEHIKRTNLLEQKLEPVEKHVHAVNSILKFVGFLALLAGLLATIKSLI